MKLVDFIFSFYVILLAPFAVIGGVIKSYTTNREGWPGGESISPLCIKNAVYDNEEERGIFRERPGDTEAIQ